MIRWPSPRCLQLALLCIALALCGCGGGSGGTSDSGTDGASSGGSTGASSGSSGSGATVVGSTPLPGQANVAPVYMDNGPAGLSARVANAIYVDVKVCAPGSLSSCAVISHVLVDTGSVGLRLMASAVPTGLLAALPMLGQGGAAAECVAFSSGVTWGSLRQADIRLGGGAFDGQLAGAQSVQIIGDTDARLAQVPARCAAQGALMQSVNALGGNGILGLGLFAQDCGQACAAAALQIYYRCPSAGSCAGQVMPLASQVGHPVQAFARDNNGSQLVLPALAGRSALRLDGLLVFGIATQTNNRLPASSVVLGASAQGFFQSRFNGNSLPNSFIDSGSTVNFLPPAGTVALSTCGASLSRFLCPVSDTTLVASNTGRQATAGQAQVLTVNAANAFLAAPLANAYVGLGADAIAPYDSLDLGASFFIGRTIATLIENRTASGLTLSGPAFAHTP